ncbi:MAG: tRNA (adenosine(37)-N6)-threonylcarbamoyltransferase complex dimerization subunit type 1 TsaB [Elainellaceae cyanobacterium]
MNAIAPSLLRSNQYALAIHTASPDLGLAISNFAGDDRQQVNAELGRDISTQLQLRLAEFLAPQTWADLAFLAVAKGPGGFTGTRLGVVTARTIAQQLEIPLFAISTLAAVAWMEGSAQFAGVLNQNIAVQMPAHRGELYTAIYTISVSDKNLPRLLTRLSDTVMSPELWQQTLDQWHDAYRLVQVEGGLGNTTQSLLELAYLDWQQGIRSHWSEALPFYGQSPV